MKNIFFLAFIAILFTACYPNERGFNRNFYSNCKEYYDANGIYHKSCPKNIINFPKRFQPQD